MWFLFGLRLSAVSNPGASTAKGGPRQNVDVTSLPMWRGEKCPKHEIPKGNGLADVKAKTPCERDVWQSQLKKGNGSLLRWFRTPRWTYQTHVVSLALSKMCWETSETTIFFHQLLDGFCFSRKRLVTFKPRSPWVERDRFSCDIVGHFGYGKPRGRKEVTHQWCLGHLEICIAIGHVLQHEARGC